MVNILLREEVEKLVAAAEKALKSHSMGDKEAFLLDVGVYLDDFEIWYSKHGGSDIAQVFGDLSESERASVRPLVERLMKLHSEVINNVQQEKDNTAGQLSDVHRRGVAARAYIDQLPSRISITGKRKG